ncbi:MAG: serine/threonine-protein kinase [Thermoanaerobaculia bacterium]|nr:serine/threonine-protein kinase [Thermoanaerobaculia bacterium]
MSDARQNTGSEAQVYTAGGSRAAQKGSSEPGSDTDDPWKGQRIGPYQLETLLGRGGMGSVYAATRADGAYEHRVAVKIVHRAIVDERTEMRFLRERQILAQLEHPGIARILDGGVTSDRVPYLVMDLVEGAPITEVADRNRSDLAARIGLFLDACRAVEAAHRNLVVHRDLKPANVLVDDEGRVKLLDFGVAKLLDGEPGDSAVETRTGQIVMTPAYASPEQILGDTVGTASDVYSLGLILFELLVGRQAQPVTDSSPTGLFQTVCGQEIPPPSRAVAALDAEESSVRARSRSISIARWPRQLRGDLDVIVGRCLSKDPERRYGSAGELAQDLERYRTGLPVEARPDSLTYRVRKLVGRHRTAFVAASLALAALVVGLVFAVGGMLRARDAERRMAAEAQASQQTADFLVQLFAVSDPKERSDVPSARTLLDRAAGSIEKDLDRAPEVRARLLGTLARVYANLGAFDRAAAIRRQQLAALDETESDVAATAVARSRLADALNRSGEYEAGLTEARNAVDSLESAGLADSLAAGQAYTTLGIATWMHGDYPTAHEHLQHALELRETHQDPSEEWRMQMLNNLAILEVELGMTETARERYETALELSERLWGGDDVRLAPTLNNLALLESADERSKQAEAYHRRALTLRETNLGASHPDVAETLNNLGDILAKQGRYEESQERLERARDIRFDNFGPEHPWSLTTRFNLARNLRHLGDPEGSRVALDELMPLFVETFGREHSYTSYVLAELADLDLEGAQLERAHDRAHEALAIRTAAHGPDHPLTQEIQQLLAAIDEAMLDAANSGN